MLTNARSGYPCMRPTTGASPATVSSGSYGCAREIGARRLLDGGRGRGAAGAPPYGAAFAKPSGTFRSRQSASLSICRRCTRSATHWTAYPGDPGRVRDAAAGTVGEGTVGEREKVALAPCRRRRRPMIGALRNRCNPIRAAATARSSPGPGATRNFLDRRKPGSGFLRLRHVGARRDGRAETAYRKPQADGVRSREMPCLRLLAASPHPFPRPRCRGLLSTSTCECQRSGR